MNTEKLLKEAIQSIVSCRRKSIEDIENIMFLKRDLGIDDSKIKDLIAKLEEIFNIDISAEDLKDLITVDDIITCVRRKRKKKKARQDDRDVHIH